MKIAFNTGRAYSATGQRMAAFVDRQHGCQPLLVFVDFTRHISGCIPVVDPSFFTPPELARYVMDMYDRNQYTSGLSEGRGLWYQLTKVEREGWELWLAEEGVKEVHL